MKEEQQRQENVIPLVRGMGQQQQRAERTFERSLQALNQEQAQLRACLQDLQRDWLPRDPEFWNAVLDVLHTLRSRLEVFLDQVERATRQKRIEVDESVHLMANTYSATTLIDTAGIAVTAYLPHAASLDERYLQQRHGVLLSLQCLAQSVQEVLDPLPQEGGRHE